MNEQHGDQSFKKGARIAELWQFKAQKVKKIQEEFCLTIFKPGFWRTGFFRCSEKWYHFKKELMVSKMIV